MEKRKEILPAGRGMKDVQVLILTPSMAARRACDGLTQTIFSIPLL